MICQKKYANGDGFVLWISNKTKTVDNKKTVMYDFLGFAAEKENKRKDFLALDAIRAMNEKALIRTVIENDISMCGVLGAYVAVLAAKKLNLQNCRLAGYDTSASVSGDTSRVVGYAGLYFY